MYIFYLLCLWYFILFFSYRKSWNQLPIVEKGNDKDFVSVLIACRNEERNITNIIQQIKTQNFNKERFELIVINDHSEDSTLQILEKESQSWKNLTILCMNEGEEGKKKAIEKGISFAQGDIILCVDADCSVNKNWIETMIHYFSDENIKMLAGPVIFFSEKGVFQQLQSLEFISLVGSGAAAIGRGKSIFCNGANLAYRKSVFLEVNTYNNIVSGDDVFLMHLIKEKYPNGILFAKNKNAIVKTKSQPTLKAYINQRKRWVAKSTSYKDFDTIAISILVLLMNLSIITLFIITFFNNQMASLFLTLFLVKFLTDYFFLSPVLNFFNRKELAFWILPFEIIYSFYIIAIVVLSFINSFEWKGRIHKK